MHALPGSSWQFCPCGKRAARCCCLFAPGRVQWPRPAIDETAQPLRGHRSCRNNLHAIATVSKHPGGSRWEARFARLQPAAACDWGKALPLTGIDHWDEKKEPLPVLPAAAESSAMLRWRHKENRPLAPVRNQRLGYKTPVQAHISVILAPSARKPSRTSSGKQRASAPFQAMPAALFY